MKMKRITSIILILNIVLLLTVCVAQANSDLLVRNISVDSENKLISIDGIVPPVKTNNVLSVVMIDAQKEIIDNLKLQNEQHEKYAHKISEMISLLDITGKE